MGLMQEGLRRSGEIRTLFPEINHRSSETKTNMLPLAEPGLGVKIGEISRMLSVKQKEKLQPYETGKNGFEPFVNPQPTENPLFVNGYTGNFETQMELDRKAMERLLGIAHPDGKVVLVSMPFSRTRSVDANPDGTVTGKGELKIGEKINDDKENPLKRVISIPEGWRIEINDRKIIEHLDEKKLTGEKLQKTFIKKFNKLLNQSLFECIWKEKLTTIKDEHFRRKIFISVLNPVIALSIWAPRLFQLDLSAIAVFTSTYLAVNLFINLLSLYHKRLTVPLDTNSSAYVRKLDARWEHLMPEVEVDKVARSWMFLSLKGKKLVREAESDTK